MKKYFQKFFKIKLPLWVILFLAVDISLAAGVLSNLYFNKQKTKTQSPIAQTSLDDAYVREITQKVLPASGYTTSLKWGNIVKRLVEVGAIDETKFREIFKSEAEGAGELYLLTQSSDAPIAINENNSRFVVNVLWALGLTQKSKVLDEGPMKTSGQTANMASTGGWTIGKKDAMQLYSSELLIDLSQQQQNRIQTLAENVYRPCCGNPTSFPDCNHGMAALGYIELAVAAGLSDEQIYKDLLAFNSFWFPQTYVEMAVYFDKEKVTAWEVVDAKLALSKDYSSAQGAQRIAQAVQDVPGLSSKGGSCGA